MTTQLFEFEGPPASKKRDKPSKWVCIVSDDPNEPPIKYRKKDGEKIACYFCRERKQYVYLCTGGGHHAEHYVTKEETVPNSRSPLAVMNFCKEAKAELEKAEALKKQALKAEAIKAQGRDLDLSLFDDTPVIAAEPETTTLTKEEYEGFREMLAKYRGKFGGAK